MENIWEQIKININQYLQKEEQAVMDEASENMLKAQIMQIANKDAPVRQLMCKCIVEIIYTDTHFIFTTKRQVLVTHRNTYRLSYEPNEHRIFSIIDETLRTWIFDNAILSKVK